MTNKDKELLLKDVCARLPYGVIVETPKGKGHVCNINLTIFENEVGVNISHTSRNNFNIEECKPYLFPRSSMTEEQRNDYNNLCAIGTDECGDIAYFDTYESIDYLYKIHVDVKNLIPKRLAIDATNLNIY